MSFFKSIWNGLRSAAFFVLPFLKPASKEASVAKVVSELPELAKGDPASKGK